MADAVMSGACEMIGLGRAAVLEPDIPKRILSAELTDDEAFARPHLVKGQWLANMIPVKVVGSGLPIQYWYFNMKRLGAGLKSDPDKSIPGILWGAIVETVSGGVMVAMLRIVAAVGWKTNVQKVD